MCRAPWWFTTTQIAFVLAAAMDLGSAQLALAADMPVNAQPFLPPRAVVHNDWSGCYVGLQGGGGWGRTEFTNTINTTAFGDLSPGDSLTTDTHSGFIGGGQVGCNYQLAFWVFGVEGSFAAANIKGDLHNTVFGNPLVGAPDDVFTTKINSIGTVTGRVGYAWNNWLLYAKGGYAGANVEFSVSDTNGFNQGSGSETTWRSGWTAGTGLEYGITPNWIIGIEYDYINLGTASYDVGGSGGSYAFDVQPRIHQVIGRFSYKFGP
jgi:outer membrane immunogenic protein